MHIWIRTLLRDQYLVSMCFSVIPKQFVSATCSNFDIAAAEKFLHWFKTSYQPVEKICVAKSEFSHAQVLFSKFNGYFVFQKLIIGKSIFTVSIHNDYVARST